MLRQGERVAEPGPELLAHAQPGAVHWTGGRAARFADEGPLEVDAASPQGEALPPGVSAPPGSVVILHEGLTADNRVWHRNEVVLNPGPELLAHCEPGVVHWSTHKPAARLVPGQKPADLVAQPEPARDGLPLALLPERAQRLAMVLEAMASGASSDQLRTEFALTKGEAKMLGLVDPSPAENAPEQAHDPGQEAPSASEPDTEGAPEDSAQEAPQEPSGEVKDQF